MRGVQLSRVLPKKAKPIIVRIAERVGPERLTVAK
jgi:hypothetical protein